MIKINFIEEEIRDKRHAQIRRYAIIAYSVIWAVVCGTLMLQYEGNLAVTRKHEARFSELKSEIDASYPHFRRAYGLYQKSNEVKQNLEGLYEHAFEPRFVLTALMRLAATTPGRVWLSSVELTTQTKPDDDEPNRNMLIRGNLLFEATDKQEGRLESLRSAIQAHPPFSQANIAINLEEMQVAKYEASYYHTFELLLHWSKSIL